MYTVSPLLYSTLSFNTDCLYRVLTLYFRHRVCVLPTTTACAVYSPSISDTDRLCCVLTLYFRHRPPVLCTHPLFPTRPPVLCTHSLFPTPIACAVYSASVSDTYRLCCVFTLYFRHRPPDALFILTLCFQWAPACRRARCPACICPSFPWCTGRTSGCGSRW